MGYVAPQLWFGGGDALRLFIRYRRVEVLPLFGTSRAEKNKEALK